MGGGAREFGCWVRLRLPCFISSVQADIRYAGGRLSYGGEALCSGFVCLYHQGNSRSMTGKQQLVKGQIRVPGDPTTIGLDSVSCG